jgi:hypothetical protein
VLHKIHEKMGKQSGGVGKCMIEWALDPNEMVVAAID